MVRLKRYVRISKITDKKTNIISANTLSFFNEFFRKDERRKGC